MKINASDCNFSLTCLPEDSGPEGHFASGDDDMDREDCAAIRADYDSGNDWAWCVAKVTATWRGLSADAYLGGCSYASEADFRAGGYYDDMCAECLADLQVQADNIGAAYLNHCGA